MGPQHEAWIWALLNFENDLLYIWAKFCSSWSSLIHMNIHFPVLTSSAMYHNLSHPVDDQIRLLLETTRAFFFFKTLILQMFKHVWNFAFKSHPLKSTGLLPWAQLHAL